MTIFDNIKNLTSDELYGYMQNVFEGASFEKPQCKFCHVNYSPRCNMQWCKTAFRNMCGVEIYIKK
jgi:hypothetical protein